MRRRWLGLALGVMMNMGTAVAMPVDELGWRAVNDTVMGGVSEGRVEVDEVVRFEGLLSLEHNGGFASVRAPLPPGALTEARALRVVLRGDGRTYALTLRRADVPLRAGSYRVPVATEQGRTEVVVPLSAFRPTSYGRPVAGAPALDTALERVDTIGFLLADKQPGPFALEVVSITPVRGDGAPTVDRAALREALLAAIGVGVSQYNGGQLGACRQSYEGALREAIGGVALTPGERALVTESLEASATMADGDAAWTLRYAIDSLLAAAARFRRG